MSWFAVCISLVLMVIAQPPYNAKHLLHGPDLPGMPVPITVKGGDGQQCAFLCNGNSKCRAFNWLPPDCDDPGNGLNCPSASFPNGCCWLKSEASSVKSSPAKCGGSFILRPDPASIPSVPITPPPKTAKNVLYILVDDMRPDAVPFVGPFMHTPHLDSLASSPGGVYFSGAYCNIAVCSPSRMSFLTGRYPHRTRTWNFINHFRQATCQEHPGKQLAEVSSAYRTLPMQNGGAGQCCSFCTAEDGCEAWHTHKSGHECTLYRRAAKTPSDAPAGSIGGLRGTNVSQQEWISLPQHFRKNGYYTLSTGKIFHTEEGGSGPAPWDGEGTGMPPLQDPPSWSQPKPFHKNPANPADADDAVDAVQPGNASMYNVNSMAPMRQCAWDKCSIKSNLKGDVQPPIFQFCDRIISDDAILKLDAAASNYRSTGQPFFLATGFRKPHLPFRHPSAYDALYPDIPDIKLAKHRVMNESVPPIAYHETGLATNPYTPMADHKAKTLRRDYYAAISWTDYNIGRVLSELDRLGLSNDTLVVFHSDHGWSLGEHGQWEKFTNWEHGTRVPLIIRAPWLSSPGIPPLAFRSAFLLFVPSHSSSRASRDAVPVEWPARPCLSHSCSLLMKLLDSKPQATRVPEIVQLIDVFPTMAELAGVGVPGSYHLDGTSFASVVTSALTETTPTLLMDETSESHASSRALPDYALSVYPRCPAHLDDPTKYWAQNSCTMKERSHFPFMGLSLRVQDWRYTEWVHWNGTALSPLFDKKPVGVELYSHEGDDGSSFDGPYEVHNLAELPKYENIRKQLAQKLRAVYPKEQHKFSLL